MPTPILGLGAVTSVDAKTIDLVVTSTPPARKRELVDVTALDSTLQTYLPGVEQFSEFKFRLLRDPDDTDQTSLYTLFGSKATVSNIITFTDPTATTWTFNGFVSAIEPGQLEHNQAHFWDVTIQRNGAITVA